MANRVQSSLSSIDSLLEGNKEYQKTHQAPLKFLDVQADPQRSPSIIILTCADARLFPQKMFNIPANKFLIIRNAGGRASDALRSIAVLDQAFGMGAVIIVHHTDCGLSHGTNEQIRKGLKERDPEHAEEIERIDFGEIPNQDFVRTLEEDVGVIKTSKWFSHDLVVKGFLYDLESGEVKEVVA